jgi:hypothetical protein
MPRLDRCATVNVMVDIVQQTRLHYNYKSVNIPGMEG